MKNSVSILKIMSCIGMGLGFLGTIISSIAESKQNEITIKEEVAVQIANFFTNANVA